MADRPRCALAFAAIYADDLFDAALWQRLDALCEVSDRAPLARLDDARAGALLPDAEILLTGWACPPLTAEVLDRAPRLRLVAHAAGTVKLHVTEACFARGLRVTSAAAANALPVAEYTLAAILWSNKRVLALQRRYRELRALRLWSREEPGLGNLGKRIGIVGCSRIGRRVIELLAPFDLEVWAWDPTLSAAEITSLGARAAGELDDLMRACDVVSLHAPALAATRHLLDRRRLALLRDGATLINTARGWLVEGPALEDELRSGRIHAVIDTTEPEVLPADSPLYDLPNVFLTPHIAGSQGHEVRRMTALALDEIERFARGEPLRHEVRREDWERVA
jgi:phosphoglycerate dehydrogenase-like enzyme